MNLLGLIRSRNRCLEKILTLTDDYSSQTDTSDLQGLEPFQEKRAVVFKAIDLYDRKISEVITEMPRQEKTNALVDAVKSLVSQKEELTRKIFISDDKILKKIEAAQRDISKEMQTARRNKASLNKFKSSWVTENGEEVDKSL